LPAKLWYQFVRYWQRNIWHKVVVCLVVFVVLSVGTMYGIARWYIASEAHKPLTMGVTFIPDYATNNAHMFYILCRNNSERNGLLDFLNKNNVNAVTHYLSLHKSPFYISKHGNRKLPFSDMYSDCLIRLPFFYELQEEDIIQMGKVINSGLQELV